MSDLVKLEKDFVEADVNVAGNSINFSYNDKNKAFSCFEDWKEAMDEISKTRGEIELGFEEEEEIKK